MLTCSASIPSQTFSVCFILLWNVNFFFSSSFACLTVQTADVNIANGRFEVFHLDFFLRWNKCEWISPMNSVTKKLDEEGGMEGGEERHTAGMFQLGFPVAGQEV